MSVCLRSLKAYTEFKEESRILEIGCGADGIINYISKGEKTAVDPLMDYYTSNFTMSKEVNWISGVGEDIPFEDEHFDIVLTINTLDIRSRNTHRNTHTDILNT